MRHAFLFLILLSFSIAGQIAAKPEVNAAGMNLNAFGSAQAGAVDLASGTLSLSRLDVDIPGRHGMNIQVIRQYNSKTFKASPKWSQLEGDAYTNYAGQDLKKIQWQGATPAQFGGWIGNGWSTQISGRLLHISFENRIKRQEWWGASTVRNDHHITDIIVVQTQFGSYSFRKNYSADKDGVKENDAQFFPCDKGNKGKLVTTSGGYLFFMPNGHKYVFKEKYYQKSFKIDSHTETSMRSVIEDFNANNVVVGEYLSVIEDPFANHIYYDYEKGTPYAFDEQKENLAQNIFGNGYQNAQLACNLLLSETSDKGLKFLNIYLMGSEYEKLLANMIQGLNPKIVPTGLLIDTISNAILNGGNLDLAIQAAVVGFVKGAILDTITNAIACIPGLGQFVVGIRVLLGLFFSDVYHGQVATNLWLQPMRPIRVYDDAGNSLSLTYIEPQLPNIAPTTKTTLITHTDIDPETGEETQWVEEQKSRIPYDFENESDNYSRLRQISYPSPKGVQNINYIYDANGLLIEVDKPGGDEEHYDYTYYYCKTSDGSLPTPPNGLPSKKIDFDRSLANGAKYDNKGSLLTAVHQSTGLNQSFEYTFVHARDLKADLSGEEDAQFSSFVLVSQKQTGKKDDNTTLQRKWTYDGYSSGQLYNLHLSQTKQDDTSKRGFYFGTMTLTDPQGNESQVRFNEGLPVFEQNALGHVTYTRWDLTNRLKLKETVSKKGYETSTEYQNYDDFGFPADIVSYGQNSPRRTQHVEYERSPVYLDNHILDKVKKSTLLDQSDNRVYGEVEHVYDAGGKGQLLRSTLTNPSGGNATTTYRTDPYGNVVEVTDALGHKTATTYENGIYPIRTQRLDVGFSETKTYAPYSLLVESETDINGNTTRYEYDLKSRITQKTTHIGNADLVSTIRYDDNPDHLSITLRSTSTGGGQNKTVDGLFNAFGKLYRVTLKPDGLNEQTMQYQYNAMLGITSITDPSNRVTRYGYDEIDRLVSVTKPDGHSIHYDYLDSAGKIVLSDEKDLRTTYAYDGLGHLIEVRLPNNVAARYRYNALDKMTDITDLRGLTTHFDYDPIGNVDTVTYPNGGMEHFSYDRLGNVTEHLDRKGERTTYSGHDSLRRPSTVRYSDNTQLSYTYDTGYKGAVSRIEVSGPDSQSTRYTYDAFGHVIAADKSLGDLRYSVLSEYDDTGLLLREKDTLGNRWQENVYDKLGRITAVKADLGTGVHVIADNFTYNDEHLLTGYNLCVPNIKTTFHYDPNTDRQTQIEAIQSNTNRLIFSQAYSYDEAGNRVQTVQKEPHTNGALLEYRQNYEYDNLYQLTKRMYKYDQQPEIEHLYRYDAAGNRTLFKHDFATQKVDYAPDSQQERTLYESDTLGQAYWLSYSHDANGNRIQAYTYSPAGLVSKVDFSWNALGQLTQIKKDETVIAANKYDAVTGLRYDLISNAPPRPAGTPPTKGGAYFVYDEGGRLLSSSQGGEWESYFYLGATKIGAVEASGKTVWFLNDILGTPVKTTNGTGTPNTYYLDPWGNYERTLEATDNVQPLQFTGKFLDEDPYLFYFHARFYDPTLGRFLGEDPAALNPEAPKTLNPYMYAGNGPVTAIDPDGRRTYFGNGIANSAPFGPPNYAFDIKHALIERNIKDIRLVPAFNNDLTFFGLDIEGISKVAKEMANISVYSNQLADQIRKDIELHPLDKDEQLNIIGYSGFGQVAVNAAEKLKSTIKVSNIILIGSPVLEGNVSNVNKVTSIFGGFDPLWSAWPSWDHIFSGWHGHTDYFDSKHINHTADIINKIID